MPLVVVPVSGGQQNLRLTDRVHSKRKKSALFVADFTVDFTGKRTLTSGNLNRTWWNPFPIQRKQSAGRHVGRRTTEQTIPSSMGAVTTSGVVFRRLVTLEFTTVGVRF